VTLLFPPEPQCCPLPFLPWQKFFDFFERQAHVRFLLESLDLQLSFFAFLFPRSLTFLSSASPPNSLEFSSSSSLGCLCLSSISRFFSQILPVFFWSPSNFSPLLFLLQTSFSIFFPALALLWLVYIHFSLAAYCTTFPTRGPPPPPPPPPPPDFPPCPTSHVSTDDGVASSPSLPFFNRP